MKNPNDRKIYSLPASTPNLPWPTFSLAEGERRKISSGIMPEVSLNQIPVTPLPPQKNANDKTVTYGPETSQGHTPTPTPVTKATLGPISAQTTPMVYGPEDGTSTQTVQQTPRPIPQIPIPIYPPTPPVYQRPPQLTPLHQSNNSDTLTLANWALGLGIASLLLSLLVAIPAVICGYMVLQRTNITAIERSRAQWGIGLAISFRIFSLVIAFR